MKTFRWNERGEKRWSFFFIWGGKSWSKKKKDQDISRSIMFLREMFLVSAESDVPPKRLFLICSLWKLVIRSSWVQASGLERSRSRTKGGSIIGDICLRFWPLLIEEHINNKKVWSEPLWSCLFTAEAPGSEPHTWGSSCNHSAPRGHNGFSFTFKLN